MGGVGGVLTVMHGYNCMTGGGEGGEVEGGGETCDMEGVTKGGGRVRSGRGGQGGVESGAEDAQQTRGQLHIRVKRVDRCLVSAKTKTKKNNAAPHYCYVH